MIEGVVPRLREHGIECVNVHDSIIVDERHTEYTEMVLRDELRISLGFVPTVRIK